MTSKESIKVLQHCGTENYCHHYIETGNCYGCNRREALDMAIEALKANDEDEPQFYTEDDYWNGMFTESAEAYKAWTGEEMGGTSERQNVAYICDKRRCDKEGCSNCGRTTDIEHAKNFELINNTYYERW